MPEKRLPQPMTPLPTTPLRDPALDNLRALMMWLGIVLHVAANHLTGPMLVPWRDQATSPVADLLAAVIHTFRMPVFLMLAGYFVAMLVERRGLQEMLRHRMRRIALPFVVFWPVLYVLTGVLVMLYAHRAVRGHFGISRDVLPLLPHTPMVNTLHLWFLYQLVGLTLLTFGVLRWAPRLPHGLRQGVAVLLRRLAERSWGPVVLALPLGLIGAQYSFGILTVTGSFLPPLTEWLHHGLFYAFGYFLHVHRAVLLAHCAKVSMRYLFLGAFACVAALALLDPVQRDPGSASAALRLSGAWAYNTATWFWSLGLIGLALRHLHRPNPVLNYLAESAYWVYLVHMLGTIGFGALLYGWALPAEVKMLLNIGATTVVCLVSYQLFVRDTAIGQLLNGRRVGAASPRRADGRRMPISGSG